MSICLAPSAGGSNPSSKSRPHHSHWRPNWATNGSSHVGQIWRTTPVPSGAGSPRGNRSPHVPHHGQRATRTAPHEGHTGQPFALWLSTASPSEPRTIHRLLYEAVLSLNRPWPQRKPSTGSVSLRASRRAQLTLPPDVLEVCSHYSDIGGLEGGPPVPVTSSSLRISWMPSMRRSASWAICF